MKNTYQQQELIDAKKEIAIWRRRELDNMIFMDSEEKEWFTEILLSKPLGLKDVDGFANFMLDGYRETKKKKT